jgi:hypothetical protein
MKILFGCLSFLFLGGTLAAQAPEAARFKDPDGITADPTGLLRDNSDPGARPGPRYPRDLSSEGITGAPVVAFVIDTTGRVEMQTASFLNPSRREFEKAVCDFLPTVRFQPFVVAEQKWRVLLVEMFAFNTWAVQDTARVRMASALSARSQEEFSTKPIRNVVAQLAPLPHCDSATPADRTSAGGPSLPGAASSDVQPNTAGSFVAPEEILAVTATSVKKPIAWSGIKYPSKLEGSELSEAVVVAFVIDTSGAVESGTVTFLKTVRFEFAAAVCNFLPQFRYAPVVVEGRKRRVLVVHMDAFLSRSPDRSVVSDASTLRSQLEEEFAGTPIRAVIERLRGLPHC